MKKSVKLLSGLALAAAFIFVGFSSFTTPEPVVDCGCPPGWTLHEFGPRSNNPNLIKDLNGDRFMCYKDLKGKKANGNNLGNAPARNWKDNNKPCD